jgi:hypothetical protein
VDRNNDRSKANEINLLCASEYREASKWIPFATITEWIAAAEYFQHQQLTTKMICYTIMNRQEDNAEIFRYNVG